MVRHEDDVALAFDQLEHGVVYLATLQDALLTTAPHQVELGALLEGVEQRLDLGAVGVVEAAIVDRAQHPVQVGVSHFQ